MTRLILSLCFGTIASGLTPAFSQDAVREGVSSQPARDLCDGQPIADQASERIPTPTHTGVVNTRFQWIPGYLDIPIYLWKRYHIKNWIIKHQAVILKYAPTIIKDIANWEAEKNYIILTGVGVLKYLHKF